MSQNNDSGNHTSDEAQREHRDEEHPRFGRGRRGNQEENGQNRDRSSERKNDGSKGPSRDSNKSESGSGKNNQNNQENSETSPEDPAGSEDENQDKTSDKGESRGGRDNESEGRGRDDRSEGGHSRDNNSDGRSERGDFDEDEEEEEEECEYVEVAGSEEECDDGQKPELGQPGNGNHDFSDNGDHSDHGPGPNHHLSGGPGNQAPSSRAGFMEKASAYTITFSNETMFEVLLGSMLLVVSAVVLFIYMVKRQRRKTMRSQSPVQFVTPNQNIATANFYQYYQKQGLIPTGTVVGYIPEGQFLEPDAKNSANPKSFGRFPTQDEILDLS